MAQELELKVDSNKYEQRISMLESHIAKLEDLMSGYTALKNRVGDFMGDDDNIEEARKAADIGIKRCNKAIEAVKANIESLQTVLNNINNIGGNVKTILQAAVEAASVGLYD